MNDIMVKPSLVKSSFRAILTGACVCAGFIAASNTAMAQAAPYTFDKTHTTISGSWMHWGFSRQAIEFTDYDGTLMLDFDDPSASSIEVTIRLADKAYWLGAPESDRFENHAASKDLFDIAIFPTAKFVSTSFETEDGVSGVMHGDLTLKGQTHPVSLEVKLNKRGVVRDNHHAGFSAHGVIKRSDWGMGFGVPAVSDEIKIMIETEVDGPAAE